MRMFYSFSITSARITKSRSSNWTLVYSVNFWQEIKNIDIVTFTTFKANRLKDCRDSFKVVSLNFFCTRTCSSIHQTHDPELLNEEFRCSEELRMCSKVSCHYDTIEMYLTFYQINNEENDPSAFEKAEVFVSFTFVFSASGEYEPFRRSYYSMFF